MYDEYGEQLKADYRNIKQQNKSKRALRPSKYLVKILKEAEKEKEASPVFSNTKDMAAWFKDKNRKYERIK